MNDEYINLLRFACEDLAALQEMMRVVEDHPEYAAERETLKVVIRALSPIISDIQEVIDITDERIKKEHV